MTVTVGGTPRPRRGETDVAYGSDADGPVTDPNAPVPPARRPGRRAGVPARPPRKGLAMKGRGGAPEGSTAEEKGESTAEEAGEVRLGMGDHLTGVPFGGPRPKPTAPQGGPSRRTVGGSDPRNHMGNA